MVGWDLLNTRFGTGASKILKGEGLYLKNQGMGPQLPKPVRLISIADGLHIYGSGVIAGMDKRNHRC